MAEITVELCDEQLDKIILEDLKLQQNNIDRDNIKLILALQEVIEHYSR